MYKYLFKTLLSVLLGKDSEVELLGCMADSLFNFLKNCHPVFIAAAASSIPTDGAQESPFPTPSATLALFFFCSRPPDGVRGKHLFVCLSAIGLLLFNRILKSIVYGCAGSSVACRRSLAAASQDPLRLEARRLLLQAQALGMRGDFQIHDSQIFFSILQVAFSLC